MLIRDAAIADLPEIVRMLADDPLGQQREHYTLPLPQCYQDAFMAIQNSPDNRLLVAEVEQALAGVLQLTIIPSMTYQGRSRALIEGVRVAAALRGQGIGRQLFAWAIEHARERGCRLVQLSTDKQRPRALRFYASLGFVHSHAGLKLHLQ